MLELSRRITSATELEDLGIMGLGLPENVIKTAVYDKKEIQSAAYDVLSTWLKQQNNRREAYTTLHAGLKRAEMNQLAFLLKQWVEGTAAETSQALTTTKHDKSTVSDSCSSSPPVLRKRHQSSSTSTKESKSNQGVIQRKEPSSTPPATAPSVGKSQTFECGESNKLKLY